MIKRFILILMLMASTSFAQEYISGGAQGEITQDNIDKVLDEINYHQTWMIPTSSSPSPAYIGGYYDLSGSVSTFTTAQTWGTADNSYAAHFMIVIGAVPSGDVVLSVTGDKISDSASVAVDTTVTLTIPSGSTVDSYFETPTKWLGQVSVIVTSGTPISCNYGYCKYWDNGNTDFTVTGGESIWMGDYDGRTINIELIHHKSTGWTYQAAAEPDPPTPLFSLSSVHGTNVEVNSNEYGCFKRAGGSFPIDGSGIEGVLVRFTFETGGCIEYGQLTLMYSQ